MGKYSGYVQSRCCYSFQSKIPSEVWSAASAGLVLIHVTPHLTATVPEKYGGLVVHARRVRGTNNIPIKKTNCAQIMHHLSVRGSSFQVLNEWTPVKSCVAVNHSNFDREFRQIYRSTSKSRNTGTRVTWVQMSLDRTGCVYWHRLFMF